MINEIAKALECECEEALRLYYLIPFESIGELLATNDDIFSDQGLLWEDTVSELEKEATHVAMLRVLLTLTEKENYVLSKRYGLLDDEPMTLEQVGNEMGVTRERVRQIESKALRKLQS